MDAFIEKSLQKTSLVDYATIKSLLTENGYTYINDKIKHMKQKGLLIPLKRGLYIYKSPYVKKVISKEIVANNLLGPSYISLDYALYYHGLIPERVEEVTSITTKRSKTFTTPIGFFSYSHINKELYALGIELVSSSQGGFMMASPIKALCDKIFMTKGLKITSKKSMILFLEDDLRIDNFGGFDVKLVRRYAHLSKSKKIEFLYKVLKA